jgi:hypothetical protein
VRQLSTTALALPAMTCAHKHWLAGRRSEPQPQCAILVIAKPPRVRLSRQRDGGCEDLIGIEAALEESALVSRTGRSTSNSPTGMPSSSRARSAAHRRTHAGADRPTPREQRGSRQGDGQGPDPFTRRTSRHAAPVRVGSRHDGQDRWIIAAQRNRRISGTDLEPVRCNGWSYYK